MDNTVINELAERGKKRGSPLTGTEVLTALEGVDCEIEELENLCEELEKQGVELGKNYNVSVCYLGQTSGSNSAYSDAVAFTAYKYLAAPTLEYNAQSKSLQWNIVDHADKYQVYFSPTAQPITITENNLDLSTFAGGEYNFSVVALSDSAFYRQSPSSNAIIVPVIYSIKPFESASFDKGQMILTLQGSERLSKILP